MLVVLEARDLWEAVEEDYKIPILLDNPIVVQLKTYKENKV
jgi:hypothetical protein